MAVTPASLRTLYPEFSDAAAYPDQTINAWVGVASMMLDAGRWSTLIDFGTTLFVCHQLAIKARSMQVAAFGGVPGQSSGILQSKSVDKVSQSYDTATASEEGGGSWNLTVYGQEYIRLARQMGIGPVIIGLSDENSADPGYYYGPGGF